MPQLPKLGEEIFDTFTPLMVVVRFSPFVRKPKCTRIVGYRAKWIEPVHQLRLRLKVSGVPQGDQLERWIKHWQVLVGACLPNSSALDTS